MFEVEVFWVLTTCSVDVFEGSMLPPCWRQHGPLENYGILSQHYTKLHDVTAQKTSTVKNVKPREIQYAVCDVMGIKKQIQNIFSAMFQNVDSGSVFRTLKYNIQIHIKQMYCELQIVLNWVKLRPQCMVFV